MTDELIKALRMRGGYEVVEKTAGANQVRLIGRVPSALVKGWLIIVRQILVRSGAAPWSADVSKSYFLRSGQVMFGWRLIFQGQGIEQYLPDIVATVVDSPRPKSTVMEQPLAGASANRNKQTPGSLKGAALTGKSVVGPVAHHMLSGR
jgi:hypothetical protein